MNEWNAYYKNDLHFLPVFYLLDTRIKTQSKGGIKHQLYESNNTVFVSVCAYECFVCALVRHTQGKQTQTEWQAKMWRESHLSTHVLWQSASGISEPAWPLLLHMTPQCIGRPRLTTLTELPRSPYICLVCHSGTQPCQRKFTACMNNNLNKTFQHSGIQSMSGSIQ